MGTSGCADKSPVNLTRDAVASEPAAMTHKYLLALLLALAPTLACPEVPSDNPRILAMFEEDQAARASMPIDWSKVAPMDAAHREGALRLLRGGAVRTSRDYFRAAMIMQHGDAIEDIQIAYSLARLSVVLDPGDKQARWLSAAAWDRILMSKDVPQWYGTQLHQPSPDAPMELYPVAESVVSDEERASMNVPSLQEAKDMLLQINR